MVEQRRKDPGRKGRPADRGGKTRRSRPDAGRSSGAALGRGRGRRSHRGSTARAQKRPRPRRQRLGPRGLRIVAPSDRWRPMRPVGGGPSGSREQPSPAEQASEGALEQAEQTPRRHGILGRLLERDR